MLKCECCGSTEVYIGEQQTEFPYKGYIVDVDYHQCSCDYCGQVWTTPEQVTKNVLLSAAAKAKIDNWILTEGDE